MMSDRLVASTGSAISRVPGSSRLHAVHAVLFHVPEDVLVHDDGVVDDDPDGQRSPSIVMLFSVNPMIPSGNVG